MRRQSPLYPLAAMQPQVSAVQTSALSEGGELSRTRASLHVFRTCLAADACLGWLPVHTHMQCLPAMQSRVCNTRAAACIAHSHIVLQALGASPCSVSPKAAVL